MSAAERAQGLATQLAAGRSVVVVGPAGIGKTTLVRAAIELLPADTAVIHAATSETARGMSLAAFAHVLEPGAASPVERLSAAFRQLSSGRHLIVIDDAHQLDDESAVLVQHLVAHGAAVACLTQRESLPLADALGRLVRDGTIDTLAVPALTQLEVVALVERELGGLLNAASAELMVSASGGNPLHARELLAASLRAGLAYQLAGVWTVLGVVADGSAAELIARRISDWPENVARVARLVASGSAVPRSVAEACEGVSATAAALAAGVVRPRAADGALVLEHPLVQEVLRSQLGPAGVNDGLEALVQAAVDEGSGQALVAASAWLAALGEDAKVGVDTLVAAAERMVDEARPHAALRLAQVALSQNPEAARAVFLRANAQLGMVVDADDPELCLRAARGAVEAFTFGLGSLEGTRQALAAARLSGLDEASQREIEALHQIAETLRGAPIALCLDQLMGLVADHPGELPALIAGAGLGTPLVAAGRYQDCVDVYDRIDEWGTPESVFHRFQFAVNQFEGLLGVGRVDDALALLDQRLRRGEAADSPTAVVMRAAAEAQYLLGEGQPAEAARHLGDILALFGGLDSAGMGAWAAAMLEWSCAWAGLPTDSAPSPAVPSEQGRLLFSRAELATATAAAELGRTSAAREQALYLGNRTAAEGHWGVALLAIHLAARVHPGGALADSAARAGEHNQGPVAAALVAHVAALAAQDHRQLADLTDQFARLGRPTLAHECALQAAAAALETGRRSEAARLRTVAQQHLGSDRRPTFAARLLTGAWLPDLTVREWEVARLAAAGRTHAEVSEQLGISRRTAENHLHSVYTKAGVSDRAALSALLGVLPE